MHTHSQDPDPDRDLRSPGRLHPPPRRRHRPPRNWHAGTCSQGWNNSTTPMPLLTALHDPAGEPAVQYHLSAKGKLTLTTASPDQPLPPHLQPLPTYNPARRRRPTPSQSTRLPDHVKNERKHRSRALIVPPLTIAALLLRQLTLRVTAAAAATASEVIPHRAIRHAISPDGPSPRHPRSVSRPLEAAGRAALDAVLGTADSQLNRQLLAEKARPGPQPLTAPLPTTPSCPAGPSACSCMTRSPPSQSAPRPPPPSS